jgi:hypothetical protein
VADINVNAETGGHIRDIVHYTVHLQKGGSEMARDLRREVQILHERTSRTAMCKPANEKGLLHMNSSLKENADSFKM